MDFQFQNPIMAGGNLARVLLKSPNFVHGVSGWQIAQDGSAEFQDIIIPSGSGGATVYVQSTAPVGANVGDLWFDSAAGYQVSQWSGSAWVAFQYGTSAILPGSITAALIHANTITAAQIATGIVVAGIVNGTTITGATIVADGSTGQLLVYSGTPATGNLIASVSGASGTDSHGNALRGRHQFL
jgi:hypothetical protein